MLRSKVNDDLLSIDASGILAFQFLQTFAETIELQSGIADLL